MAAESSHRPASKKRNRETTEPRSTEFWGADFALLGGTLAKTAQEACQVCSSCQTLLIRPTCDPSTIGTLYSDPGTIVRRSLLNISNAALNGCIICQLLLAAQVAIGQHKLTVDRLYGFQLALYWLQSGQFDRIDIAPVHSINGRTSDGNLDAIKLVLEDKYRGLEDRAINYPSPLHTGSELCRSLAMRWLINCITHHPKCREHHSQQSSTDWLPTRLIDVGLPGNIQLPQLILSSELKSESNNSYATLSHRWTSTHVVKLESSNIDSFRQCIPSESLSRTFVDAITVTRALGIRYLWIDSLCIIQDSLADWQSESAKMESVYGNCVCNIAATGSSDNGGGLFQERNANWVTPNRVHLQYEGHDKIYLASLEDPWGKWISRSTLNRRGWVLQERMLSPRTLHFASQLFWECRMLQACETYPESMPPSSENRYMELDGFELPMSHKNWHEECEEPEFWTDVVQSYGRCSITRPGDRLIAIAGVAKSLQPVVNDKYLAGLWMKDLPYNLVWYLCSTDGKLQASEDYRCPSWSWAALDYTSALVENVRVYDNCRVKALVSILEAYIEPLGSEEFGPLRGGYLRLTGRIGRIFPLADTSRDGKWINGHWSFETFVDLYSNTIDDESLYCLPILVRRQNPGPEWWPIFADCLLLKELQPGTFEFTRVGLLKVALDLEDTLPDEIKWIVEYAESGPPSRDLHTITIY